MLTEQDKKEIRLIFAEGINQLVTPQFDKIYNILGEHTKILGEHSKKFLEIDQRFNEIDLRLDKLERILEAEVSWRDGTSKRFKRIELKLGITK